jgi:hypothetical protein
MPVFLLASCLLWSWNIPLVCLFQVWNKAEDRFDFVEYLISDGSTHTHKLATPLVATLIRIGKANPGGTSAMWPAGNIGLAELALHGANLGCR